MRARRAPGRRKPAGLLILLIIFLTLWACTRPGPVPPVLIVGIEANPTMLDPRLATDAYGARIGQLLFNGLIRFDEQLQARPDLAESWETPDPTTYIFHLKRGVTFHDGTPLTAEAVRQTFETIRDPAFASPHREAYAVIERIETPDPSTVIFRLRRPHAPFLAALSRGIVRTDGPTEVGRAPVGTGPFRLTRWVPDERLEFTANPDYFEGRPRLAGLTLKIIPEDTIRLLEIEKGSVQFLVNNVLLDAVPLLRRRPELTVLTGPSTTVAYVGLNLIDPILRDRRVRQALAYALDRATIIAAILNGLAQPANGFLPPGHWAEARPITAYPYDPARARRLLDEAGYPDPDGPGPRPRFTLLFKTSQNEQSRRVAEVLQQQWREVGVGVEIRQYEWGTFYADIKAGNFQLYTLQWVGIADPDFYHDVFHSASVPPNGANRGRYANPEVDRLTEEGRRTLDPARRATLYRRVQQILADDLPMIPLWHPDNIVVMRRQVQGFRLFPSGDFLSLKEVWLGP